MKENGDPLGKAGRVEMRSPPITANGDEVGAETEIVVGGKASVAPMVWHTCE